MSITPGPVNLINLASGALYGYKKTIPFVLGATIGFALLLIMLGVGTMQIIIAYPIFLRYMSVVGAVFIFYLGYKLAKSDMAITTSYVNCPKFIEGFFLQWLNPKAWLACVSGISLFVNDKSYFRLLIFVLLYFVICFVSLSSWVVVGQKIKQYLRNKKRLKVFNRVMGVLLSTSAIYIVFSINNSDI
jgi:threonine/homoserine/homoserine lactone efflux protein